MRRLIWLALALSSCSRRAPVPPAAAPTVHVANLVEVGGAPGPLAVTAVAHLAGGGTRQTLLKTVAFPWHGAVAAAVPLLPFDGVSGWTLTLGARTVTLVDLAPAGAPGAAALAFVDQLGQLDAALRPGADASAFAAQAAHLHAAAADVRALIVQAQAGAAPVGVSGGAQVSLDARGLALLDKLALGAQEPFVSASSLTSAAAMGGAAFVALLSVSASANNGATASADVGTFSFAGLLAGPVSLAETVAQQAFDAMGAADPASSPSVADALAAAAWGDVQAQLHDAIDLVTFIVRGPLASDAANAAGGGPALHCDPARCNCLVCNSIWAGCFPQGQTCCGTGLWARACPAGQCSSSGVHYICDADGGVPAGSDGGAPDGGAAGSDAGSPDGGPAGGDAGAPDGGPAGGDAGAPDGGPPGFDAGSADGGCASNGDCGLGGACYGGLCGPASCSTAGDCPTGWSCAGGYCSPPDLDGGSDGGPAPDGGAPDAGSICCCTFNVYDHGGTWECYNAQEPSPYLCNVPWPQCCAQQYTTCH